MDLDNLDNEELQNYAYSAMGDAFVLAVVLMGPDLVIRWANPSAAAVLGHDHDQLIGKEVTNFLHPDDLEQLMPVAGQMVDEAPKSSEQPSAASVELPARVLRAGGGWTEMVATGWILDSDGNSLALIRPNSERHAFDGVLDALGQGSDLDEVLPRVVNLIRAQFNVPQAWLLHDAIGVAVAVGEDDFELEPRALLKELRDLVSTDESPIFVIGDNWIIPVHDSARNDLFGAIALRAVRESGPSPWDQLIARRTAGLSSVVFTRDRDDAMLRIEATTDHLTGVLNRRAFEQRLVQCAKSATCMPLTLMFVDLDDFKSVNDAFGHSSGDTVLENVAAALRRAVRSTDFVGRIGGDEFAVGCPRLPADEVDETRRRLTAALAEPVALGDEVVRMSASVGVSTAETFDEVDMLMDHSDADMFTRKGETAGTRRTDSDFAEEI